MKPGKWGTTICFTAPVTKKKRADDGTDKEDKFWILKSYTVFNLDQVEGDFDHLRPSEPEPTKMFENFEAGDELIAATGADIRTGNRACYVPSGDYIVMPPKESFHSAPDYYETVFHEMAHWTEPEHRLNWDRKNEGYAMGELIAEISACYLAAELGIPNSQRIDKSAAYLKSWLDCLKGDSRAIFRACSQASKSCALLLDCVRTPEPVDHGPLALQEILLAGCPTVGVRTGAAFVRHGETGVVADRLPPGARCAESDDDVRALAVFMEAIEEAQSMDRHSVRDRAASEFDSERIVDSIIIAVNKGPSGRRNRDCGKRIITGVKLFIESYAYD